MRQPGNSRPLCGFGFHPRGIAPFSLHLARLQPELGKTEDVALATVMSSILINRANSTFTLEGLFPIRRGWSSEWQRPLFSLGNGWDRSANSDNSHRLGFPIQPNPRVGRARKVQDKVQGCTAPRCRKTHQACVSVTFFGLPKNSPAVVPVQVFWRFCRERQTAPAR